MSIAKQIFIIFEKNNTMKTEQDQHKILVEKKQWITPDVDVISCSNIESGVAGAYEANFPSLPTQSILAVS